MRNWFRNKLFQSRTIAYSCLCIFSLYKTKQCAFIISKWRIMFRGSRPLQMVMNWVKLIIGHTPFIPLYNVFHRRRFVFFFLFTTVTHPVVFKVSSDDGRSERTGRVHGGSSVVDGHQMTQSHRHADGQRRHEFGVGLVLVAYLSKTMSQLIMHDQN